MDRVRVLIVDDQRRVREGLKALLGASTAGTPTHPAEIQVVGQAASGLEAVRLAGELQPDVVVMDIRMPNMDGLEATRLIKARWPHIRVILLTLYADERRQALATPADAFLVKGCSSEELLRTVYLKSINAKKWDTRMTLLAQTQAMPTQQVQGIGAKIPVRCEMIPLGDASRRPMRFPIVTTPKKTEGKDDDKNARQSRTTRVGTRLWQNSCLMRIPSPELVSSSRGRGALGYTMQMPTEDRYLLTTAELKDRIAVMLAGRAAESIVFNEISTGASDKLGNVRYATQQYQFLESGESTASASPATLELIDEEVQRIASEEYARAQQLLKDHRAALEHLTHQLLETECVDGAAVKQALAMQPA